MYYSIILNPTAGNSYAKSVWPSIKARLDQAGVDYQCQTTKYHRHAEYLAQKLTAKPQDSTTVVAIGGDGTLNEVLNGLLKDQAQPLLPLAFIPTGIRNDFARGYGISLKPLTALQQILDADHNEQITIGHYHDAIKGQERFFLNSIGIGFDAAVTSKINNTVKKHRVSRFAYFKQAINILYNQQPFSLMVQGAHGREYFPKAYIVIASNHPFIGGRFKVASTAQVDEPVLDLLVAERKNWLMTFWQLFQLSRGKLDQSRFAKHFRAQKFHYTTPSLEFGQVDGEEMGNRFMDLTLSTSQYPFHQTRE